MGESREGDAVAVCARCKRPIKLAWGYHTGERWTDEREGGPYVCDDKETTWTPEAAHIPMDPLVLLAVTYG